MRKNAPAGFSNPADAMQFRTKIQNIFTSAAVRGEI
jgi:hypothetical protein